MAEIVRGIQFGKKKNQQEGIIRERAGEKIPVIPTESASAVNPDDQSSVLETPAIAAEHSEVSSADVKFLMSRLDDIPAIMGKVALTRKFIKSLEGFSPKRDTMQLRSEIVRENTLEALWNSLEQSNEHEWRQKPSYYLALLRAFSSRLIAIRNYAKETEARRTGGTQENMSINERLQQDILYAIANSERVIAASKYVDVITNYILDTLGHAPDQKNIALRKEGLVDYSLERICNFVLDSHEPEWRQRPSFYGAVILELNERTQAVKTVIGEQGD